MMEQYVTGAGARERPRAAADPLSASASAIVALCAFLAGMAGVLALIGWWAGNPILKGVEPEWTAMKPNSALSLILAGISLWLLSVATPSGVKWAAGKALAAVTALVALLTVAEHLLGVHFGIDGWLFVGPGSGMVHPGQMALGTAASLLFISVGLLLIGWERPAAAWARQILAIATSAVALIALVGYAYDVPSLYSSGAAQTALNTAFALFALSVGLLLARRDVGLAALLTSRAAGGSVLRRLLPAAVLIPLILGWLRLAGQHAGVLEARIGLAMLVIANMLVFISLVAWNSVLLQRTDTRRQAAEEARSQMLAREQAARAEAEAASARFRGLVESAPDGIIIVDREARITLANAQAEKMLGYRQEELLGQPIETVVPERFREGHVGYRNQYMAAPRTRPMGAGLELFARRKDGSEVPVEISLSPVQTEQGQLVTAIVRDITDRKHAEQALRESEERFRLIVESVSDYAIITLDTEGRVTTWNPGAERINGYRTDEILGKHVSIFYPPEQIAFRRPEEEMEVARREGRFEDEGWRVRKDGSRFWANVVVTPIREEGGHLRGFVKITRDITGRREAEEQIRALNTDLRRRASELEAANKELEAFSYSVSHDLRAPLRSIDGFSQALLEDYSGKLDEMGQDYLRRVRAASQRMGHLIDDILKLSRVIRAEMRHEPVDLSAAAQAVAQELQESQPERKVDWHIAPNVVVQGDPQLLRVVLDNLIGNAFKFTGKQAEACIEFGTTEKDGEHVYYVRDNGAGFDTTYKDKLFHAFQRLHGASEFAGTGIGLATVQRIVTRHGGRIWADSAGPGQGATFSFTLGG